MATGVRVAHWAGGDVVVPDAILSQHEHAAFITSAADRHFARAKLTLKAWMQKGPHQLTAWHRMLNDRARASLRHACMQFAEWCLGHYTSAHWKAWKEERLSRGEDLYAPLCVLRRWLRSRGVVSQTAHAAFWAYTWARKDQHLLQYAADSRRRFTARRDAFFRTQAIRIATGYSSVTIDSYKISALKVLPSLTMPGDTPRDQAQHNAQAAGPGRFREILIEVMGSRCTPSERTSGEAETPPPPRKKKTDLSLSPETIEAMLGE